MSGWTEDDLKAHLAKFRESSAALPEQVTEDQRMASSAVKQSKYSAIRTVVDGVTFASRREARVYSELKMRERAGEISELTLQPRYPLTVCGVVVATYVGDFRFYQRGGVDGWTLVVADAKGFKTPMYRLKKKLMHAVHGIDILEL